MAVDDQAATPARQQVLAPGAQHGLEPGAQRRHPRATGRRESRRLEIVERGPHRLAKGASAVSAAPAVARQRETAHARADRSQVAGPAAAVDARARMSDSS